MHRQLNFRKARAGQEPDYKAHQLNTVNLQRTENDRAKFLVAKGITEQVLLSCDDLINLLIVHQVTCRSCTEVGRHEMACTGCREKEANKRAPADTPRDPKRGGILQHRHYNAEENKIRHPDGNTKQSIITNVQEDESRSQRRTHRRVSRDTQ